MIGQILLSSDLDCRLTLAVSREQYLDAFAASDVDLILSDNRDCNFDSLDWLRLLRRNHPTLPFLFLSGTSEGRELERLKAERTDDCLLKSDVDSLVLAIRTLRGPSTGPDPLYLRGLVRLVQVVQELSSCRDVEAIVSEVCHAARQISDSDAAVLVVRKGEFCHVIDQDSVAPQRRRWRYPLKHSTRGLPVVILTLSHEETDLANCFKLSVNSSVMKPVDFDKFAETVTEAGLYQMLCNRTPGLEHRQAHWPGICRRSCGQV